MSGSIRGAIVVLSACVAGCAGRACETGAAPVPAARGAEDAGREGDGGGRGGSEAAAARPEPEGPSCEARVSEMRGRVEALAGGQGACLFDVDCAVVPVSTSCFEPCPPAVAARGVRALREASAAIERELCPAFAEAGCSPARAECAPATPRCAEGRCLMDEGDPVVARAEVPAENERSRTEPPPRPPPGDAEERAARLFEAIVHDDPDRARDFFFPLEAFREVKGIGDPDGYWARLFARFEQDIHALHGSLPDLARAEFERLEIVRRGGFVLPGEEANRLPYWAARHNRLHYRVDGQPRSLEVRVLITWGTRWYVTHLSEFH